MGKKKSKKHPLQNTWVYAIFWIIVIILIGYIFYSSGQYKELTELKEIPIDRDKLETRKKEILDLIKDLDNHIKELKKRRLTQLIVARIFLVLIICTINLIYYFYFVPAKEKHGFMVNHFNDITSFIVLTYSATAFLFSGSMKAFSEKIHNALFNKLYSEEEKLTLEKEALEFELKEIEVKLMA